MCPLNIVKATWEETLERSGGLSAGLLVGYRVVTLPLAGGQQPNSKGGKTTPFFVRGKQDGHSTRGRPDLHQNTRVKSQLLSEIFRPAGTKPHITHRELHLVLPLGTADIAKYFLTTILST